MWKNSGYQLKLVISYLLAAWWDPYIKSQASWYGLVDSFILDFSFLPNIIGKNLVTVINL